MSTADWPQVGIAPVFSPLGLPCHSLSNQNGLLNRRFSTCHSPASIADWAHIPTASSGPQGPAHFSIHTPSLHTPTSPQLTKCQPHHYPLWLPKHTNLCPASGLSCMLFPLPGMLFSGWLLSSFRPKLHRGPSLATPSSGSSNITCLFSPRHLAQRITILLIFLFHVGAPTPTRVGWSLVFF